MSFPIAKGIGASGRIPTPRISSGISASALAGAKSSIAAANGSGATNDNAGVTSSAAMSTTSGGEALNLNSDGEEKLVEVEQASIAANEVFTRVKSEKIAEQTLCSIRNDQAQYEGLAKEIVSKAIKQKERERANRASAAASRAKVLRYQTELELRLNRLEAERNLYRKTMMDLREQLMVLEQVKDKIKQDDDDENEEKPSSSTHQDQRKGAEKRKFERLIEVVNKAQELKPYLVRSIVDPADLARVKDDEDQKQPQVVDLNNLANENSDIGNRNKAFVTGNMETAAAAAVAAAAADAAGLLLVDTDGSTVGQIQQGSTNVAMNAAAAAAAAVGGSKMDVDEADHVAKKRRLQEV